MLKDKEDEQLFNDLENGDLAYELTNHEGWKLIVEAMKRIERKASETLLNTDPDDKYKVLQLQQIIKLYRKDFIPALLENWKAVGKFAFEEAKDRGILVFK